MASNRAIVSRAEKIMEGYTVADLLKGDNMAMQRDAMAQAREELNTTYKYLGLHTRDIHPLEYTAWLVDPQGEVSLPLDDFMRLEGHFLGMNGVLSCTNTSAYMVRIVDEDTYKVWLVS